MILTWGFDPERQGGIARFCIELAVGLQRLGVDVELWGVLAQGTMREQQERQRLHALGVRTHVVPPYPGEPQTALTAMITAAEHVRRTQPRFVSVHGVLAELCGISIAASSRVPVIRTVHSEREWYKRPRLGRLVDQLYARWGAGEIGVSSRITEVINRRRTAVGAQTPACWIPPISDAVVIEQALSITQAEARKRLGMLQDGYVVGSVGRFTPQKGYDILIDAAALVRNAGVHQQVYIVGEGPLEGQLREQIARLQLQNQVQLFAPRPDIGSFLRALDLFVSSSRWEGMSLIVQEAALCGLPLVCTAVSGTDDVRRLIDAPLLVCSPDDPQALAQAILAARQGDGEAQDTRHGGTRHETREREEVRHTLARSMFTPEAIARQYLEYFETIAHNPKSKTP